MTCNNMHYLLKEEGRSGGGRYNVFKILVLYYISVVSVIFELQIIFHIVFFFF